MLPQHEKLSMAIYYCARYEITLATIGAANQEGIKKTI